MGYTNLQCRVSSFIALQGHSSDSRRYDGGMSTTKPVAPDVLARARKIKLFLMDVDGTITDGSVNLISSPEGGGVAEMKAFNSQDGAGLKLAHIMGIRTGFITGRKSPAVIQRAHELKVEFVYLGQETKMAAFNECLQKAGVQEDEVAYMGDDLPDMPAGQTCRPGSCRCRRGAGAKRNQPLHHQSPGRRRHRTGSSGTYPQIPGKMGRGSSQGSGLKLRPNLFSGSSK